MQLSADRIWSSAQEQLRSMLSADTYNLWFAKLRACSIEGNNLTLEVANDFCEVWLKDNYSGLLRDVLTVAGGKALQAKFKVANTAATAPVGPIANTVKEAVTTKTAKSMASAAERAPANGDWHFNPKNTFEAFVVGNNNNFAYAAALAVAQTPGKSYNPLFLYGGVGLGKTHLLHAIGQYVASHKKGRSEERRVGKECRTRRSL